MLIVRPEMALSLFAGALLILSPPVIGAEWYQVETIIFEHLKISGDGELWRKSSISMVRHGVEDLSDSGTFKKLPESSHGLADVKRTLKSSGIYRPLYHVGWKQPRLTQSQSKKVWIQDLGAKIDGTISVVSGHLLHVVIDFSYFTELIISPLITDQTNPGGEIIVSGTRARIKEIRRVKLNELHYIDNPLFGVLIRITRTTAE